MTVPVTAQYRTAAAASDWRTMCWSPELGKAVAISNSSEATNLMTSTDGITWTGASAGTGSWESVCWSAELSLFVVVGTMQISTSPDGVTWTSRTPPAGTWIWTSICWSKEKSLFVAVASGSDTGTRVITSPDGITWTLRTTPANNSWKSVTYGHGAGVFVAVSSDGTGNRVMTSPDGTTWTSRTTPTDRFWVSVCWSASKERFVAVTSSSIVGVPSVVYSTDGITWYVPAAPTIFNQGWSVVLWLAEIDRFFVWQTTKYSFSADGIQWESPTTSSVTTSPMCWAPQIAKVLGTQASGVAGVRAAEIAFKKVTATIVETFTANKFKFFATGTTSKNMAGSGDTTGAIANIPVNTSEPVMVIGYADHGTAWTATTAYSVGDKVFPTNPVSSPWYYEATVAGTTGASEPTWSNTLVPIVDGTVTWLYQESLIKPIANGPLIPA